jgi:hypothetical protein
MDAPSRVDCHESVALISGTGTSRVDIADTILNAGAQGANIDNFSSTITSHGYNLSSDDGGGLLVGIGDQTNTAPMLGPLQNNGGPTFTHALLAGSPAVDQLDGARRSGGNLLRPL